ncbi:MAG: dockerin type I domain-containing protein [Candidatus Paceibacterota bacterium]|jgi:hypothetical protein
MNKKLLFWGLFLVGFFVVGLVSVHAQFAPGDRVKTITNVNVRYMPSPSGTVLGVQPMGSQGIVLGGPTSTYFYVNFDINPDGYVSGAYLSKVSTSTVCGDADGDGSVNISDATYLIAYIFSGGPAPSPILAGDVNSSGNVDISDATYLIAYIFSGGPAPVCNNNRPVLTVSIDSSTPPADQITMGSTNNPLAVYRLGATGDDIKVLGLNVFQNVANTSTVKSAFSSMNIYSGNAYLGTAGSALISSSKYYPGPGYYRKFNFTNPLIIPKDGFSTITIRGDVASYSSSGATDGSWHVFRIATSSDSDNYSPSQTVTALGNTSNSTATVNLYSGGSNYYMTVLRTKLAISSTPLGPSYGRAKATTDELAQIIFTADPAGALALNRIRISFSGTATATSTFLAGVTLYDTDTGTSYNGTYTPTSTCSGAYYDCTKEFDFGSGTSGYVISAGASKSFTLRINSLNNTAPAVNGIAQTLVAKVSYSGDVLFTDGATPGAISYLTLPSYYFPIAINSVSYAVGTFLTPKNPTPSLNVAPTPISPLLNSVVPITPISPFPIIPTAPKTMKGVPSVLGASTYDTLQSMRYQLDEMAKQLLDILGQINR